MKLFTETQLSAALAAYGTSSSAHVSRLIALADMRQNESVTLDDVAVSLRHAAACLELGKPFDDYSAQVKRAAERISGFSDSTFQRYNVVLEWVSSSLSDDETLVELLASDTFTADALSALCQLASGKIATRKMASDTVAEHIVKRDSGKIVSAYRRLLAASNAKAKSKRERAKSAKAETTTTAETAERTPDDILADLSIPAMAELLLGRIAASVEDLTADDYAALVDTLTAITAMLEESEDN